jgi:hypothetical protein
LLWSLAGFSLISEVDIFASRPLSMVTRRGSFYLSLACAFLRFTVGFCDVQGVTTIRYLFALPCHPQSPFVHCLKSVSSPTTGSRRVNGSCRNPPPSSKLVGHLRRPSTENRRRPPLRYYSIFGSPPGTGSQARQSSQTYRLTRQGFVALARQPRVALPKANPDARSGKVFPA